MEFQITIQYKIDKQRIDLAVAKATADRLLINSPLASIKVEGDNQIVEWSEN
jgi:hypothetical protein